MTQLKRFRSRFLVLLGLLTQFQCSITSSLVIRQPSNWTVVSGSDVILNCDINDALYDGFFEWRVFRVVEFGQRIFSGSNLSAGASYTQDDRFPADKYRRQGTYGLNIIKVDWKDGAMYQCDFIRADTKSTASVIVIDELTASVGASSISTMSSGAGSTTRVLLTCSVSFGGPLLETKMCNSGENGQFPRLQMSIGTGQVFDDSQTNISCIFGLPGGSKNVITMSVYQTLSAADVGKQLVCSVSTQNPTFMRTNSTIIQIMTPAHNVTIDLYKDVYEVDDVINCTALGWPLPNTKWRPVSTPQSGDDVTLHNSSLRIVADMVGYNVWECAAANSLDDISGTEAVLRISFNVTDDTYRHILLARSRNVEAVAAAAADYNQKVALAVGLALGLLGLVALGIIIALLLVKKRSSFAQNANGKPSTVSSIYSYTTVRPAESDNVPKEVVTPLALTPSALPTTSTGPIYQPRPASVPRSRPPSVLDRSGHGDLGIGVFHLNSTTYGADPMYPGSNPANGYVDGRPLLSNGDLTSPRVGRRGSRRSSVCALSDMQSPTSSDAGGFADLGLTSGPRPNSNFGNNTIGRLSRTSSLNRSRDYLQQPPRRQSAIIDEEDMSSYYGGGGGGGGVRRVGSAAYRPAVAEKSAAAAEMARVLKLAADREGEMDSTRSSSLVTSDLATVI